MGEVGCWKFKKILLGRTAEAGMSNASVGVTKTKKQRKRASLVCSSCKEKKIKCDRQKPCSNCIKSSSVHSCNYNYEVKRNERNNITIVKKELNGIDGGKAANNHGFVMVSTAACSRPPLITDPVMMKTSIMDTSFHITKSYLVMRKPSRTHCGMQVLPLYGKTGSVFSFSFLQSFKDILEEEISLWKSRGIRNKGNLQLKEIQLGSSSDTNHSNDELNTLVEKLVCNNYYAILERLGYFQTYLNKILLGSYIPMGVVQLIFHHYFNMKREGIAFRHPKKNFEYAFIALITSLVELTNIFTQNNPSIFNFSLSHQNNEFNELSVMLLNRSNYRRKCSIFAVYAILNLRLSLMVYGNTQSAGVVSQNSFPLFETAANMCIEMGIGLDLDKVVYLDHHKSSASENGGEDILFAKEIPVDSLKTLWNHLLVIDASYFVCMSAPPYIDDRYNHGFYLLRHEESEDFNSFVSLVRELSLLLLSERKCTFRELLDLSSKMMRLLSSLESFDDIHRIEENENKWRSFYLKFQMLNLLSTFLYEINFLLNENNLAHQFPTEVLKSTLNQEIVKGLKKECATKIKLLFFIAMNTIRTISRSKLSYKFWLYIREAFLSWIGMQPLLFIDLVVTEETDGQKQQLKTKYKSGSDGQTNGFILPPPVDLSNRDLETALFDFNPLKYSKFLNTVDEASQPLRIVSYMSGIHENLMQIPLLIFDYTFFVKTKLFLIGICFLYSYIKYHSEKDFEIHEYLDKLKTLMKKILKRQSQKGSLTPLPPAEHILGGSLENSGISVGNEQSPRKLSATQNPPRRKNILTGDQWNNTVLPENNMSPPSHYDRITTSIFEDESLLTIFKDIDDFFSQEVRQT